MAAPALDIPTFRLLYPAFASPAQYPDVRIEAQWDQATLYFGEVEGPVLSGRRQQGALYLMTAHLLALGALIAGGQTSSGGTVTSATIDKVSVTLAAPSYKSGWDYWLGQTPYGTQLIALLRTVLAGGFYVGGSPERFAFRRVGGGFGPAGLRG